MALNIPFWTLIGAAATTVCGLAFLLTTYYASRVTAKAKEASRYRFDCNTNAIYGPLVAILLLLFYPFLMSSALLAIASWIGLLTVTAGLATGLSLCWSNRHSLLLRPIFINWLVLCLYLLATLVTLGALLRPAQFLAPIESVAEFMAILCLSGGLALLIWAFWSTERIPVRLRQDAKQEFESDIADLSRQVYEIRKILDFCKSQVGTPDSLKSDDGPQRLARNLSIAERNLKTLTADVMELKRWVAELTNEHVEYGVLKGKIDLRTALREDTERLRGFVCDLRSEIQTGLKDSCVTAAAGREKTEHVQNS